MAGKIVILGGGESGVGAALLAQQKGYTVFVSDKGRIPEPYKQELAVAAIPFEEGQHTPELVFDTTEVIKSPGIPDTIPLIGELQTRRIPVISEIEFAARYTDALIIGITGTNGKTTTTNLTAHLLAEAGFSVAKGGNVGTSFARLLTEAPRAVYVLELSSFQLDGIEAFRPDIAVLLNITPDHLDRYGYELQNYAAAKFRIIRNQTATDAFIYNASDPIIRQMLENQPVSVRCFPVSTEPEHEFILKVGAERFNLKPTRLRGIHNRFNAHCAIQSALLAGLNPDEVQAGLESFVNDPHRLEEVATIEGVTFVNDSKATNVEAVAYALDAQRTPVIWIAGGTDKGNDYTAIQSLVRQKVKALVCLGVDNQKLLQSFGAELPIREAESADEAVRLAFDLAAPREVVLLSPACASFDRFRNYMDRGDQFKASVMKLKLEIE